jgi:hypothetical protein
MTFQEMLAMQGKPKLRNRPRHEEENMQLQCVKWFDYQYPKLKLRLHHSPNGGKRDEREGARFKAMGTRAGFPDLILLYPNKFYPYMGIELKTSTGKQSEQQKEYQKMFEETGAKYIVVRSLDEFISEVNNYIKDE